MSEATTTHRVSLLVMASVEGREPAAPAQRLGAWVPWHSMGQAPTSSSR